MDSFKISGLKCDNTKCGYRDDMIQFEDYPKFINSRCPKCDTVWLTNEEYQSCVDMYARFEKIKNTLNTLSLINPFKYLVMVYRWVFGIKKKEDKVYKFRRDF